MMISTDKYDIISKCQCYPFLFQVAAVKAFKYHEYSSNRKLRIPYDLQKHAVYLHGNGKTC